MTPLAVVLILTSALLVVLTVVVYGRIVRELRYQIELKDEHLRQCQHLMTAMRAHPAGKRLSPDLTLITGGNEAS